MGKKLKTVIASGTLMCLAMAQMMLGSTQINAQDNYVPKEYITENKATNFDKNTESMKLESDEKYPEVPLIAQNDYPDYPFKGGTIEENGCSITSISMILTYLKDEFIGPDKLADEFNFAYWNIQELFEDSSEWANIPSPRFTADWKKVTDALSEGHVVAAMMGNGPYCQNDHFIVLTGITDEGKIMVNDPWAETWTKSNKYINGFKNGFDQEMIYESNRGMWIYDTKEEVQEYLIEHPRENDVTNLRAHPDFQNGIVYYQDITVEVEKEEE